MKMHPVKSSNIKAIGWENGVLAIEFSSGHTYDYHGVSEQQHKELMAAPSKGGHFAAHLRHTFKGIKRQGETK